MEKVVQFSIDNELYNKFVVALLLTNESESAALNKSVIHYIRESFKCIDNLQAGVSKVSKHLLQLLTNINLMIAAI